MVYKVKVTIVQPEIYEKMGMDANQTFTIQFDTYSFQDDHVCIQEIVKKEGTKPEDYIMVGAKVLPNPVKEFENCELPIVLYDNMTNLQDNCFIQFEFFNNDEPMFSVKVQYSLLHEQGFYHFQMGKAWEILDEEKNLLKCSKSKEDIAKEKFIVNDKMNRKYFSINEDYRVGVLMDIHMTYNPETKEPMTLYIDRVWALTPIMLVLKKEDFPGIEENQMSVVNKRRFEVEAEMQGGTKIDEEKLGPEVPLEAAEEIRQKAGEDCYYNAEELQRIMRLVTYMNSK